MRIKLFKEGLKKYFSKKRIIIILSVLLVGVISYVFFFQSIVISPLIERSQMNKLEEMKLNSEKSEFVTDGCSGSVSQGWSLAVSQLSDIFPSFEKQYEQSQTIPFESACVEHDKAYYNGEGGYVARLQADNTLRSEIIKYGINNTAEIKNRTGLKTDEEAVFLYEVVAETIYRGVRLGGAPCTGMPYAWGFGYDGGGCD